MHHEALRFTSVRSAPVEILRRRTQAPRESPYPSIDTKHLRLRAFGLADIAALVAMANDHHVADTVLDFPSFVTARFAQQWINSHPLAWSLRNSVHWAVTVQAEAGFIGYTGLNIIDLKRREAMLTFWMGPGIRRVLHAGEAAEAALAFAFAELPIDRVRSARLTRNRLATRVLDRIGMRAEGRLEHPLYVSNQCDNVTGRGISRSDWLACRQARSLVTDGNAEFDNQVGGRG